MPAVGEQLQLLLQIGQTLPRPGPNFLALLRQQDGGFDLLPSLQQAQTPRRRPGEFLLPLLGLRELSLLLRQILPRLLHSVQPVHLFLQLLHFDEQGFEALPGLVPARFHPPAFLLTQGLASLPGVQPLFRVRALLQHQFADALVNFRTGEHLQYIRALGLPGLQKGGEVALCQHHTALKTLVAQPRDSLHGGGDRR